GTTKWTAQTFTFVANSATSTLSFTDISSTGSGLDLVLDNVRVTGPQIQRTLTVDSTPAAGINVTISPNDLAASGNGTTQLTRSYYDGTVVNLTAPGTSGATSFQKWQKNGVDFSNSAATSVTIDSSFTMTAVYVTTPVASGPFANGSFEDGENAWTMTGNRLNYTSDANYVATNGTKLMILNAGNSNPNAVLSQAFLTTPGQTYGFSLDVGVLGGNNIQQRLQVAVNGGASLVSQTVAVLGTGASTPAWTPKGYTFVADSTTTILTLTDVSTTPTNADLLVDNVKIGLLRTLTVSSSPATGISVTVTPNDLDNNGNGTTQFVRTYVDGTVVNLTAPAASGASAFVKWQKNGNDFSNTAATSVTMDGSFTLNAVYVTNTAPVAGADSYSATQDTPLVVTVPGVLTNDTDAESSPLTAVLSAGPATGNLVLNPDGGFTYTPVTGFTGPVSFTYRASDGALNSNVVTVSINVVPPSLLVNGSFEDGENGWTMSGNRIVAPTGGGYSATDGTNLLVMNGGGSTANAVISQSFTTAPGQSYTLSCDIGVLSVNSAQQSLLVALTGNASLVSQVETLSGNGVGTSLSAPKTYTFVADSTTTTLTFSDLSSTTGGIDLLLDNVRAISAPVVPSVILTNGSFESDFTGWTPSGNVVIQSAAPYLMTDGTKLASFNAGNTTPNGLLSQSFATISGTTYTLAFDAGVFAYNTTQQKMQVNAVGASSLLSQVITISGIGGGNTKWVPQSFTFVANSATTTVTFADISAGTSGLDLVLDNVRVTAGSGSAATRTLTVDSTPATGVSVTVSPNDLSSNGNGTTQFTRTYNNGAVVSLTAPATSGTATFVKWQKNGTDFSNTAATSVTMDAAYTMTAVYTPIAAVALVNGSFESDFTGWTVTGNAFIQSAAPYVMTDGTKLASFNAGNTSPNGVVSQAFATTSGVSYTLAFDAGVLAYNTSQQKMLVKVDGTSNLLSQTITITGISGTTKWTAQTFTFVANSATSTVSFTDISTTGSGLDLVLDNVRVTNPQIQRTLTVDSTPAAGVNVIVSPSDLSSNGNGTTQFTRTYNDGAVVSLTAPATFGTGTFQKWQKGGVDFSNSAATSVTIDSSYTMTAVYATAPVPSGTNLIVNGSFESDFTGWTPSGSTRIENPGASFSTDGTKILSYSVGNAPITGSIFQSFTTVPGTTYQLNFDLGAYGAIYLDQTIRAKVDGLATLLNQTTSVSGVPSVMIWSPKVYTFTADSTLTTLTLTDVSASGNSIDMFVDRVSIVATGGGGGGGSTSVLTVNSTPNTGAAVTVSPADNSAQANGTTNFTRTYNNGTVVTLVAPYANFVKWLKDGAWYATNPTTPVTVDAAHTLTAVYTSTPVLGPFTNGSFEQEFTGWTWSGSQQSVKVKTGLPATDGATVIEFNSNNSANDGSLSQTFTTTAGTTYNVAFDMGVLAFNTVQQSLKISAVGSSALGSQTFAMNGIGGGSVVWSARTFSFTANSAATTLTFSDQSSTGNSLDLLLDNVRVNAVAVPNPGPVAETVVPAPPAKTPVPQLSTPPVNDLGSPSLSTTPSARSIGLNATVPGTYSLECSEDLKTWHFHSKIDVTNPGPINFTDSSAAAPCMFYRIGFQAAGSN
ncbi:MAG: DUF642 domain-containing protein, partial [Luteolibacter sp.]